MEVMTFVVPCLFGLEGLAAEELRRLGLDSVQAGKWPGPVSGRSGGHGHGQLVATDRRAGAFAPGKRAGPAPLRSCFKSWPPHLWKRSSPVMENSL